MSAQPEVFDQLAEMEKVAPQDLHKGKIVDGRIVQIDDAYVWVDVDSKSEGRISKDEFDEILKVGDPITGLFERTEKAAALCL